MSVPTEWKMLKMSEKIDQLRSDINGLAEQVYKELDQLKLQTTAVAQEYHNNSIFITNKINTAIDDVNRIIKGIEHLSNKGFVNWIRKRFKK